LTVDVQSANGKAWREVLRVYGNYAAGRDLKAGVRIPSDNGCASDVVEIDNHAIQGGGVV